MSKHKRTYDKITNDVLHMIVFAKSVSVDSHLDGLYKESFLVAILIIGGSLDIYKSMTDLGADFDAMARDGRKACDEIGKKVKPSSLDELVFDFMDVEDVVETFAYANRFRQIGASEIFYSLLKTSDKVREIVARHCPNSDKIFNNIELSFIEDPPQKYEIQIGS